MKTAPRASLHRRALHRLAAAACAALLAACAPDASTLAAPVPAALAVVAGSGQSAAAGEAMVVGSGTSLCVAGGTAGAEHALVSFNGGTVASRRASLSVTASGVTVASDASLVDPVNRAALGDPTDIDANGRVVLFFTRAVNELTPAHSGWYVGGFFWSRDLFPTTASSPADACAASNAGEMLYLMVPDPKGAVNGNAFAKAEVADIVTATVAHEYEHLINASRRLYVNTAAADWEEPWLDEGLAHVAEELVFYRATGLAPRQNVSATTLRRSAAYVTAFDEFAIENFGRLERFLDARYQSPSWGLRSILGALTSSGAYPLRTVPLGDGVARTVAIVGGGAAYLPFGVAAGAAASLSWGTLPTGVQLTLVRTR